MHPVLRDNDLVIVRETAPEHLRKGNILVYREEDGQYVVHRLVKSSGGDLLYLRGDRFVSKGFSFLEGDRWVSWRGGFF